MRVFVRKRWIVFLGALFVLLILFFLILFSTEAEPIVIERNLYGEGSKEETIYLDDEPIVFTVGEVEYTEEELDAAFDRGFATLREGVLGENHSSSEIRSNLVFLQEIPEGLGVEWISSEPDVILSDGQIGNQDWEDGRTELVTVTVILSYGERIEQENMIFRVVSPVRDRKDSLFLKVKKYIQELEQNTRNQSSFTLPEQIDRVSITREPGKSPGAIVFLAFAVIAVFWILRKNQTEEQLKKKQEQLREEYPVFVNQIILYLGAGMNLKNVFDTIYLDYQADVTKSNHLLYEELRMMRNEIASGAGEREAYENFGRRTGEHSYMLLMSLLLQNLQKGNEGLLQALRMEEEVAFHKRIDYARSKGEQAGTKLLFPMLILLVVVMVIVMAPALLQFGTY